MISAGRRPVRSARRSMTSRSPSLNASFAFEAFFGARAAGLGLDLRPRVFLAMPRCLSRGEQVVPRRQSDELDGGMHAQLLEDAAAVGFHRPAADAEVSGDLLVAEPAH